MQNLEAANAIRICDDDGNDSESSFRLILMHYIRDKFPTTSEVLQERLAGAMILRRKRILYRRSRYGNNPIRLPNIPSQPVFKVSRAQHRGQPQIADADLEAGAILPQTPSRVGSLAPSATTLEVNLFRKASVPSVVSLSKTVALSSHETIIFPPAPTGIIKLKQRQLMLERWKGLQKRLNPEFEDQSPTRCWEDAVIAVREVTCPYCFYAIPAPDIVDEKKWK